MISLLILLALYFYILPQSALALEPIQITSVATNLNTGYATFNSHNQKVVANDYGIFMTHVNAANAAYDSNIWRLSRSTDNGHTFTTIYESQNATSAPVIETDSLGNLYLAYPDWKNGNTTAFLYKLSASTDFKTPTLLATIPDSAHGKYTMIIDESRNQLYFLSANGTFSIIGLNGQIKQSYTLLVGGQHAYQQYPLIYIDSRGDLYVAWTTQKNDLYMYWDIHFIISKNGGLNWQALNSNQLSLPIVSDNSGSSDRITLDDEFNYHTWLSSFIVSKGSIHFMYYTLDLNRQHYVRYDLSTAKLTKNLYPDWQANTITMKTVDGFFAVDRTNPDSPLFVTGKAKDRHLATIVSYDNGESWQDFAISSIADHNLYSVGGYRQITSDGYIIGSYTDQRTQNNVYFFKFKASSPSPSPSPIQKPGDLDGDGHVNFVDFNLLISNFGNPYTIFDFNAIVSNYGQ